MKMLPTCLVLLTLAACSPKTVEDACYKNGEHNRMSDGRIMRICKCVSSAVAQREFNPKETGWAIATLNKDDIENVQPKEQKRLAFVQYVVNDAQATCKEMK